MEGEDEDLRGRGRPASRHRSCPGPPRLENLDASGDVQQPDALLEPVLERVDGEGQDLVADVEHTERRERRQG